MLNEYIDYTLLRADAREADFDLLIRKAIEHKFFAVVVPPCYVKFARRGIGTEDIRVATVVGFPLGYNLLETKLRETELAVEQGAKEIDLMLNISAFKSEQISKIEAEVREVRRLTADENVLLKVIIESGIMNQDELRTLCSICVGEDVDFIKTSSGFAAKGAEVEKVEYLRKLLPANVLVKASGNIRTVEEAQEMIRAGAARIGTSALLVDNRVFNN